MSSSVRRCLTLLNNPLRKNLQHSAGQQATDINLQKIKSSTREAGKHLFQQSCAASSHSVHTVVQARSRVVTTKDESREMMAVWPDVVRDLTDAGRHLDIPHATKWIAKVLQYNVPNGKKNRGLALVYAFQKLAPPEKLNEDNIRLARILGWCVELYQAFFLVEDDIMDGSTNRRGQLCWYRQNNIGLSAINDGLLLEQSIFQLLRTHFKDKDCYMNLIEVFHETILKTTMGQTLDLLSTQFGQKPKLELFTMNQYNSIVKYKTAFYSFVMPVSLAMYFAGITDAEMHRQAKTILLEMGHFFQVQDDFLDCYGNPEVTGKIGNDIQDGKCSWLVVVALQRATPAQKKILEECYGSSDPENVARVKQLYDNLGLPTTYSIYEEESYNLMNTHIQQISRGLPHDLFFKFLEKIYRRDH
ncbi:farnesyl pyrophosphate synthase isoform X1 [Athalia rosae]|uniref:farnesyl pyrophosphate synthase isoform X1 n=2 Tax=Athalia rosae TaxID=37344 RepID=UPI0020341063|nr:farnesyl pyrophosphate synthase isoform X1 [Athalia rosae]